MIHRELCDPVYTKKYSSLRMQFHFLLSRYVCWDGFIPLTIHEIAQHLSCEVQSIHKFIKKGIREDILRLEGDRLFLNKYVSDYKEGYIKHYAFLESSEFKALNIHTQRFILYTLWAGVHTGRPLKVLISSLYHSKEIHNGVLNVYYKDPVYNILEETKTFLKVEITNERNKEMVVVSGLREEYAYQDALENQGEKKLLEDFLWSNGVDLMVSELAKDDILKLKKFYTRALGSVGMELFKNALRKLLYLNKLHELNVRGEVGPLRSIITTSHKRFCLH
jgi:hypothetical protein